VLNGGRIGCIQALGITGAEIALKYSKEHLVKRSSTIKLLPLN
jgi:hypothetical protein